MATSFQYESDMADYEREARDWLAWVERATRLMRDRSLPSSISELHNLIHELEKFKAEDLPPKQQDKQRLASLYAELEVIPIIVFNLV